MTIYGYINDASTKERLIGAVIRIGGTDRGAITNGYGFFSLPDVVLPVVELRVTYIGYESKRIVVRSAEWNNKPLDVQLCRSEIAAGEVVIEADRDRSHTLSTEMGVVSVPIQQIQSLPSVGGEVDLLKAMQLYSGVSSGQELSNGIFVRGGNFDQNLFLLDGVTIYNPNHLFGFFSVFNMDAIKSAELIKGGFPAEYGGKLSSIISFAMNEGDLEHTVLKGGVSLIACRLSVEGPWSSEKQGSYLVSARRSYLDPAFKSKTLDDAGTNAFYIFDLTAKMNYTVTDDDRVYLSAYFGRDNFTHGESGLNQTLFDMNLIWGNQAYNFRWNHLWSSRLFSNLSLVYSDYFSKQSTSLYSLISAKEPSVKDLSLKADGEFWIADNQSLLFGGAIIDHR
ncbi:MAG TPA: TonB-dependent receptor, partial [Bacteroidota bacterium]|nr:TonB-dependent receptor [Bacteroidota bacterium]